MQSLRQALRLSARITFNVAHVQRFSSLHHVRLTPSLNIINNGLHSKRFSHANSNVQPKEDQNDVENRKTLGKLEAKLKLMFTCKKCTTRNSKIISKLAYEKGVVIARCDGCKNNHLIADNLGWFQLDGRPVNIEYIMKTKGETVRKVCNDNDGYFEVITRAELDLHERNKIITKDTETEEEAEAKIIYEKVGDPEKI